MCLVVGDVVVPRVKNALPGCLHKIRLAFDVHTACFKCRVAQWGADGLCTADRRCTECTREPRYIFQMVMNQAHKAQKRAEQRARAKRKEQERIEQQQAAVLNRRREAELAQQQHQLLSGATGVQPLFEVDTPALPSATSTPRRDPNQTLEVSFHASDLLSPNDVSITSIERILNNEDIVDTHTASGITIEGMAPPVKLADGSLPIVSVWFNVTDLSPPQRNQVGAYITMLINNNRTARGRELLINPVQPVSFQTKPTASASLSKPPVRPASCRANFNLLYQSPTLYIQFMPSLLHQVPLASTAGPSGDPSVQQQMPPMQVAAARAGLNVYPTTATMAPQPPLAAASAPPRNDR